MCIANYAWSESTIERGIGAYNAESYAEAVELLKKAVAADPDNAVAVLYMGLAHLRLDNVSGAIEAWRMYVKLDPASELTGEIKRHLTALIHEQMEENARQAIEREQEISARQEPDSVGIPPFANLGASRYRSLQKGFAAMVATDLAKVDQIRVLERQYIQAIVDELRFAASELIEPASAPRLGRLAQAETIISGSYLDLESGQMRIDSALVRTATADAHAREHVQGQVDEFFDLEKGLVFAILADLGYDRDRLPAALVAELETYHTKNFAAFEHYSLGLDYSDRRLYAAATEEFETAVQLDPEFDLARDALETTPIVATVAAIIASVEPGAGAAAAASGISVAAVEAPVPAAVTLGTSLAIVGGAVGGSIALSQSGEDDRLAQPLPEPPEPPGSGSANLVATDGRTVGVVSSSPNPVSSGQPVRFTISIAAAFVSEVARVEVRDELTGAQTFASPAGQGLFTSQALVDSQRTFTFTAQCDKQTELGQGSLVVNVES